MSSINVRASFCVSNVGTIVSSSGEPLGLGAGVGMSVCAWIAVTSAKSVVIHRRPAFLINVILSEAKNLGSLFTAKHSHRQRCFASLGMTANLGDTADKSMPPQKQVNFFRQFSANPFRSCDLLDARAAEPIHGPEPPQQ